MEEFIYNYNIFYVVFLILILPHAYGVELNVKQHKGFSFYDTGLVILALTLSVVVIGARDLSVGTDTESYLRDFYIVGGADSIADALTLIRGGADPLFTTITFISSKIGGETFYLTLLALLYIFPLGVFIFLNTKDKRTFLLLAFLSIYSFKWMAVNTVRSGIALAFGLLFVYFIFNKNSRKAIICALLAVNFHLSALLLVAAYFAAKILKRQKLIYGILIISSLLSIIGVGFHTIPFVAQISRLTAYFDGSQDYQTGFLFTYWVYNLTIAAYYYFMQRIINDEYYTHLGKIYLLLSSVYFLSFHIAYSDRIGVYSWALIPILISYPMLKYRVFDRYQTPILLLILLSFQSLAVFYLKR